MVFWLREKGVEWCEQGSETSAGGRRVYDADADAGAGWPWVGRWRLPLGLCSFPSRPPSVAVIEKLLSLAPAFGPSPSAISHRALVDQGNHKETPLLLSATWSNLYTLFSVYLWLQLSQYPRQDNFHQLAVVLHQPLLRHARSRLARESVSI